MAMMRNRSHLNISAPPPSPIPTATGSRSAANEIFTEYLENKLNVPELALPDPHFPASIRAHRTADDISFGSLASREPSSVNRLLKYAREIGALRIIFHGISEEELRSLSREAERVFKILEKRDTGDRPDTAGRNSNKEEIIWDRSGKERMEWAREYIGPELYRTFSEKIENVASKLDSIAEKLGQIFTELLGKQSAKRSEERQSVLSIYKYNHIKAQLPTSPSSCKDEKTISFDHHILSIHLAMKQCKFCVQLGKGQLSFNAGPEAIVVTIGKQLEEWSLGEFKCAAGEIIYHPDSQPSFSVELKCSSFDLKPVLHRPHKSISLVDQILIFVILILISSICNFLWS